MTARGQRLPSWAAGPTRDAVLSFLDASTELDLVERVAVFDNDGTLWCEKPAYPQLAFFLHELAEAAAGDPRLTDRDEYAALLHRDEAAMAAIGLPRLAMALADLFTGMSPDEFAARSRRFIWQASHPTLGRPFAHAVYQPMLELLDELRSLDFATFIVSGGGTEFVRAVSHSLYGIAPEGVVGTLIGYEFELRDGRPTIVRTATLDGDPNEGPAKVIHIQQHLGRRPVFAAGNSVGDREMIDWAMATDGPHLGLLVNHDDEDREFRYQSVAGTFESDDDIVDIGRRSGWTVVSMQQDWTTVFPA
jgi:phosphoglycolate phosphatase-like HAD superfamily hydrolase